MTSALITKMLEALEGWHDQPDKPESYDKAMNGALEAIAAAREYLALPEHAPVAWYDDEMDCAYTPTELDGGSTHGLAPLYAHPAPQPAELMDDYLDPFVDVVYKHWQDPKTFDMGAIRADFRDVLAAQRNLK